MKRQLLSYLACVLLLSGCAHFDKEGCRQCAIEGFDPRVVRPPNPLLPNIFVVGGKFLVVDQEPIRLGRREIGSDRQVTISWALAAGSPYTFSTKEKKGREGIEFSPADKARGIDAPVRLGCGIQGSQEKVIQRSQEKVIQGLQEKVFQCTFTVPEGRYRYKYTVYVLRGNELLEPLDPEIEGAY